MVCLAEALRPSKRLAEPSWIRLMFASPNCSVSDLESIVCFPLLRGLFICCDRLSLKLGNMTRQRNSVSPSRLQCLGHQMVVAQAVHLRDSCLYLFQKLISGF